MRGYTSDLFAPLLRLVELSSQPECYPPTAPWSSWGVFQVAAGARVLTIGLRGLMY